MSRAPQEVNHTFDEVSLRVLSGYGEVRPHPAGELLTPEGQARCDCLVTLSGETHIFVATADGARRVGFMERGQFAGDVTVLTGQTSLAWTEMGVAGEVLHIPHERFQRLLVEQSALSDVFVRVLTARREFGRSRGFGAVLVIGDSMDRAPFAIRSLLQRHGIPHHWLAADQDPAAEAVMRARQIAPGDLPVVIRGNLPPLVRPEVRVLADAFGLDLLPDGSCADLIIAGSGPAGLAAAVYAASEGLSVLMLDADGPGGQAGTSSKIENYLGFPTGISGRELAERAAVQAQKFGARIGSPIRVVGLERSDDNAYALVVEDGRRFRGRAVVVATGARYRRPQVAEIERFEGRGVHYGATPMEAQLCSDRDVALVGAGNSAGQGAVYLAQTARTVHVVYRRADIRETMSEYLVRRLEETPNIHLHPATEIAALHGLDRGSPERDRLTGVTWRDRDGALERCEVGFVFLFIGASPCTDWLPAELSCDGNGFLKTGTDLLPLDLVRAAWPLERMPSRFESSWPRVYAVGDVRTGSVKRVANAVGEGSTVVSDIHRALAA